MSINKNLLFTIMIASCADGYKVQKLSDLLAANKKINKKHQSFDTDDTEETSLSSKQNKITKQKMVDANEEPVRQKNNTKRTEEPVAVQEHAHVSDDSKLDDSHLKSLESKILLLEKQFAKQSTQDVSVNKVDANVIETKPVAVSQEQKIVEPVNQDITANVIKSEKINLDSEITKKDRLVLKASDTLDASGFGKRSRSLMSPMLSTQLDANDQYIVNIRHNKTFIAFKDSVLALPNQSDLQKLLNTNLVPGSQVYEYTHALRSFLDDTKYFINTEVDMCTKTIQIIFVEKNVTSQKTDNNTGESEFLTNTITIQAFQELLSFVSSDANDKYTVNILTNADFLALQTSIVNYTDQGALQKLLNIKRISAGMIQEYADQLLSLVEAFNATDNAVGMYKTYCDIGIDINKKTINMVFRKGLTVSEVTVEQFQEYLQTGQILPDDEYKVQMTNNDTFNSIIDIISKYIPNASFLTYKDVNIMQCSSLLNVKTLKAREVATYQSELIHLFVTNRITIPSAIPGMPVVIDYQINLSNKTIDIKIETVSLFRQVLIFFKVCLLTCCIILAGALIIVRIC